MIDNRKQVAGLLAKLNTALPLPANLTPRVLSLLRQQSPGAAIPPRCHITWVSNAGDEGGIVCKLSAEGEAGGEKQQFFVSITQRSSTAVRRWRPKSSPIRNEGSGSSCARPPDRGGFQSKTSRHSPLARSINVRP
jgi:hypothetical protein